MITKRLLLLITLSLLLFVGNAMAQNEQSSQGQHSPAPTVTATAGKNRVRYVSAGEVQQTRLQVFSPQGMLVFDSAAKLGNLIVWRVTDLQGSALEDGSYLFLVTVTEFSGRVTQKYGTATLEKGEVHLEQTRKSELTSAQTAALEGNTQSDSLTPVDRVGAAGLGSEIASVDAKTDGSPSVKATPTPEPKPEPSPTPNPTFGGTGSQNRIAKWVDNAANLGDSVVFDNGTGVGVGTTDLSDVLVAGNDKLKIVDGNMTFSLRDFSNGQGYFAIGSSTNGIKGFVGHTNTTDGFTIGSFSNHKLTIRTNSLNRMVIDTSGNVGIGTTTPTQRLEVAGNLKISGNGNGLIFADGSVMTSANEGGGSPSGTSVITAINDPNTTGFISDARIVPNIARLTGQNNWVGQNTFNGISLNGTNIVNLANPVSATDATNKAYVDANFVKFVPNAEQLSVGDANGTATMINLRGGSTCCSGPGGHTPAFFKVFQNGSFVATGNLGIGTSPMEGKGYRTSWHTYKGAFRSGYADNEWDDANVGFFSWAGGSNSTASGLYAFAFGDTNFARSTSSIAFGSGNEVKGAAGFSAGAGNRVCDTYGVALGNNAKSGGPYIDGKCDPETFNIRGLAAVAIGYNVTADQDHTTAMGKFASNNGFQGTFIWSDGAAQASADTFRNTANNEFAARATGGFRFRTNLGGTTGCNLPAGSGVFNCTSSRATKENFMMINGQDVLSRLRNVPVSTWNYISEGRNVRHMGPMAEDFYQTFKLGTGNTSIGVQDLAGVSLAAIKALDERTSALQTKTAEVEQLRAQVNELRAVNATMEQRLAALEQSAAKKAPRKAKSRRG